MNREEYMRTMKHYIDVGNSATPERNPYDEMPPLDPAKKHVVEIERLRKHAAELLTYIDTEFRSDPMSVQCFDLRIVQQVRECVKALKDIGGL